VMKGTKRIFTLIKAYFRVFVEKPNWVIAPNKVSKPIYATKINFMGSLQIACDDLRRGSVLKRSMGSSLEKNDFFNLLVIF
jgi:hypothetical protein